MRAEGPPRRPGGSAGAQRGTGLPLGELDQIIDQLVDELTAAIEEAGPRGRSLVASGEVRTAVSRAIAFRVLSGWLDTTRHRLSDPAQADTARDLIRSALHTTDDDHAGSGVDVSLASAAAERLATTLGDDFPMAIVWIAAGLDAQLA